MSQFGSPTKNHPPWVRTSPSGQQQGTSATPNSSMIPNNLINQIGFQTQQQSQHGFQPGLGVQPQSQPTSLLSHQLQLEKNKGYVTMSYPFQSTTSGQVGNIRPGNVSVQSAPASSQIPGAITYPSPRAIQQATSFATTPATIGGVAAAPSSPKRRVFTGTITKLHDNFGFIDGEVFFQVNVCAKGLPPKVGERCLVDANYNSSMPFKWNASRVEVLPPEVTCQSVSVPPSQSFSSSGPCYNAVPPPAAFASGEALYMPSHERERDAERLHERRVRERRRSSRERDQDRDRRREERMREREREKEKEKRSHSPLPRRRSRSPRLKTSRSPPRRRTRIVPKYMVQVPKISLNMADGNVMELKRRYNNLYIPSDYFCATFRWVDTFPAHKPLKLNKPCSFHILPKSVTAITENTAVLEPSDADYTFSAKVMPLSLPGMSEMISKTCPLAEDVRHEKDTRISFVHPTRLINFLVGVRGKNETMAIGGPWSPSLDGPNPDKDPAVLIRTAIRTCKALTGVDLSPCTSWYRFLDIHYHRGESNHKGKVIPSRIETVVIYLPDVWGCMPTRLEWDEVHVTFEDLYTVDDTMSMCESVTTEYPNSTASEFHSITTLSGATVTTSGLDTSIQSEDSENTSADQMVTPLTVKFECFKKERKEAEIADMKKTEAVVGKSEEEKPEPTHYSKLDLKTMKVVDIRRELEARCLNAKGLKSQMIARLAKVLKTEKEVEVESRLLLTDSDEEEARDKDVKLKQEPESELSSGVPETSEAMDLDPTPDRDIKNNGAKQDMDVVTLKPSNLIGKKNSKVENDAVSTLDLNLPANVSKKMLPENPHILVYPSRTAKSGKFDCTVMSLSLLLDYRAEDTKEHSFEVSLFAELFNEMLMRDNGFLIYRALMNAPDKNKETQPNKPTEIESKQGKENDSVKETPETPSREQEIVIKVEEQKQEERPENNSAIKVEVFEETPVEEIDMSKTSEHMSLKLEFEEEDDESREEEASNASSVSKKTESVDKTKDISKDKVSKERKSDKKMLRTTDPALLMAFLYFDQTHCGYIFDKDLEEILYMLGLNLSRAQVRKLLQKVVTRDTLNYRKLTDGPYEGDVSQSGSVMSEAEQQSELSLLASGNRVLFPTPMVTHPPESEEQSKVEGVTKSGLVTFEGLTVDLPKLASDLESSEKERILTENVMTHFTSRLRNVNVIAVHQAKKLDDLRRNLKDCTNKLNATEEGLSEAEKESARLLKGIDSLGEIVEKTLSKDTTPK